MRAESSVDLMLGRLAKNRHWVVMGLLVATVCAATLLVVRLNPRPCVNVAQGAHVTTSSQEAYWPTVQGAVDGDHYATGFHTRHENEPWVLLDLGVERPISRVVLFNRVDCCIERAVPIAVEVSSGNNVFSRVARREEPFHIWNQRFVPVQARWVRVRLLRPGYLHLTEIEVY